MAWYTHVYDMYVYMYVHTTPKKERCEQFGRDLNEKVPVKNLGVETGGCIVHERDREAGLLSIWQSSNSTV